MEASLRSQALQEAQELARQQKAEASQRDAQQEAARRVTAAQQQEEARTLAVAAEEEKRARVEAEAKAQQEAKLEALLSDADKASKDAVCRGDATLAPSTTHQQISRAACCGLLAALPSCASRRPTCLRLTCLARPRPMHGMVVLYRSRWWSAMRRRRRSGRRRRSRSTPRVCCGRGTRPTGAATSPRRGAASRWHARPASVPRPSHSHCQRPPAVPHSA